MFTADEENKEVYRQDWHTIEKNTEISANLYKNHLPKSNLNAIHDGVNYGGRVLAHSPHGAAICCVDITDTIGFICLFLTGKVPLIEQRFCINFTQQVHCCAATVPWLPALEIIPRPLFYYLVYNLCGSGECGNNFNKAMAWANGVGLAFLRQHNGLAKYR